MAIGLVAFLNSSEAIIGIYAFFSSWFQSQLLWFAIKFSVEFNPFKSAAYVMDKYTCGLVGFGKWHKQRDKVLGIVRKVIEERGEEYLFIEDKELDSTMSPKKEVVQNFEQPAEVVVVDAPSDKAEHAEVPTLSEEATSVGEESPAAAEAAPTEAPAAAADATPAEASGAPVDNPADAPGGGTAATQPQQQPAPLMATRAPDQHASELISVQVPPDAAPGQTIEVTVEGKQFQFVVPQNTLPGAIIQINLN